MTEGITCYERDEMLCTEPECVRAGKCQIVASNEEWRRQLREGVAMTEELKPTSLPLCCVTGRIAGDKDACGDCDPCSAADRIPQAVKDLMKERDEWADKYAGAMMELEEVRQADPPGAFWQDGMRADAYLAQKPAAWRWPAAGGGYYYYDGDTKMKNGSELLYLHPVTPAQPTPREALQAKSFPAEKQPANALAKELREFVGRSHADSERPIGAADALAVAIAADILDRNYSPATDTRSALQAELAAAIAGDTNGVIAAGGVASHVESTGAVVTDDEPLEGLHDEIREGVLQAADAIRLRDDIREAHAILARYVKRAIATGSASHVADLTNHHNALLCPYCNPKGLKFAESPSQPDPSRELRSVEEMGAREVSEDTSPCHGCGGNDANGHEYNCPELAPAEDSEVREIAELLTPSFAQYDEEDAREIIASARRVLNAGYRRRSQSDPSRELRGLIDYWHEMSPGSREAVKEADYMLWESLGKLAQSSTESRDA